MKRSDPLKTGTILGKVAGHKCRECIHYPTGDIDEAYCGKVDRLVSGASSACVYGKIRKEQT